MAEYIEREALEVALNHRLNFLMAENGEYDHYTSGFDEAVTRVEDFPAADVAPVRHGRWEWFEEWNPSTPDNPTECEACGWRCGECKTALEDMVYGIFDDPDDEPKLKFCPNCGAKMEGCDGNSDMA